MLLLFDDRPSDSPLVERIWECRSGDAGTFSSVAASHWEMVVSRLAEGTRITLRGPETRATSAVCPAASEWLGIRFKLGTFLPQVPMAQIRDRQDVTLPRATARSFWLDGSIWEYPTFDDAEAFVARLVHAGLIGVDPLVDAVVHGRGQALSTRSVQRRFLRATGMTHAAHRRIERARHAANLLTAGTTVQQVVHEAGYFDQAHLSRSLKRLIGQTPGQILRRERQLSFLYKTDPNGSGTLQT
jgi:hypothetical protein